MNSLARPLKIALQGKGLGAFLKRVWTINKRYGLTTTKMARSISKLSQLLQQFECKATLPITAVALARNGSVIQQYQAEGIEFAIHGYVHVDYSELEFEIQKTHLKKAQLIFQNENINFSGFRCPYLRGNKHTLTALSKTDFSYDSSPSLYWPIDEEHVTEGYRRALSFYGAKAIEMYPSLPYFDADTILVRLPYSLPDDESLIERLVWSSSEQMNKIWPAMFQDTYKKGELFNLGLHPERMFDCADALTATLKEVEAVKSWVWRATLNEITNWWRIRYTVQVNVVETEDDIFQLTVNASSEVVLLLRSLEVKSATEPWFDGYEKSLENPCSFKVKGDSKVRPLIGVSPDSDSKLVSFLKQQGYLVERSLEEGAYTFYLNRSSFAYEEEQALLDEIENGDFPLVRLGRWPDGYRSALCITGDIDALTLWDYFSRFREH